jgi:hypothetical protein
VIDAYHLARVASDGPPPAGEAYGQNKRSDGCEPIAPRLLHVQNAEGILWLSPSPTLRVSDLQAARVTGNCCRRRVSGNSSFFGRCKLHRMGGKDCPNLCSADASVACYSANHLRGLSRFVRPGQFTKSGDHRFYLGDGSRRPWLWPDSKILL